MPYCSGVYIHPGCVLAKLGYDALHERQVGRVGNLLLEETWVTGHIVRLYGERSNEGRVKRVRVDVEVAVERC